MADYIHTHPYGDSCQRTRFSFNIAILLEPVGDGALGFTSTPLSATETGACLLAFVTSLVTDETVLQSPIVCKLVSETDDTLW